MTAREFSNRIIRLLNLKIPLLKMVPLMVHVTLFSNKSDHLAIEISGRYIN